MMLKSKIAMLTGVFLFSTITCATNRPDKCPSVEAIKSQGLRYVSLSDGNWYVSNRSNYDTNQNWHFSIGNIQAESGLDALTKGDRLLTELHGNPNPVLENNTYWFCWYELDGVMRASTRLILSRTSG